MPNPGTFYVPQDRLLKPGKLAKIAAKALIGRIDCDSHKLSVVQPEDDVGFAVGQEAEVTGGEVGPIAPQMSRQIRLQTTQIDRRHSGLIFSGGRPLLRALESLAGAGE